jgi:TPR repeat protein
MCYIERKVVKENWEKAIESFTFIHDKLDDLKVNAERKAFVKCAVFAEKGSANYQYLLGNCYAHGKGIRRDLNKAIEWITKSSKQNNPQAQCFLGLCYQQGTGVKMDRKKGYIYFKKAAEQGLAQAQCELGKCYLTGDGVVTNRTLAKEWLGKAAAQHYEEATLVLQNMKPFVEPKYAGGLYSEDCSYNFEDNR